MTRQVLDPRIRRSRVALENAFWELLTDRDLTQIAISDLTKRAGVNRSTFYEHYSDVHDLAASACTAIFDELVAATPVLVLSGGWPRRENPLPRLFAHVAAHADLYRMLLGPDGSARVINHLLQRIAIAAYVSGPARAAGPVDHTRDPVEIPHHPQSAFTAGAIVGTIIDWLRHDCPGTPEELGEAVWPLLIDRRPS